MIAGVQRNYTVVGLCRHTDPDRYTVLTLRDGQEDPNDTGLTVGEFVDPDRLHRRGFFGYFRPEEVAIFRRGLTKDGRDLKPTTRRKKR